LGECRRVKQVRTNTLNRDLHALRPLEEIETDIKAIEKDIVRMLAKVTQ